MENEIEFECATGDGSSRSTLFARVRPETARAERKDPDGVWVNGILLPPDSMREFSAWLLAMADKVDARKLKPKPCMHIAFTRVCTNMFMGGAARIVDSCSDCGATRSGFAYTSPGAPSGGSIGLWKGGNR